MTDQPFPLPHKNPDLLEFLRTRRSNMSKMMTGPGPDDKTLQDILTIAARVPDHRKLSPWRFIIFQGEARERIGVHLGRVSKANNPDLPEDKVEFETRRFLRAPVVVGVVSNPVDCVRGTPEWEQRLSSAICCYNMCLAAQGHGFAAQWLTEWYSYDPDIAAELGLGESEKFSGFIYIGTTETPSMPRPRPKMGEIISHY